MLNTSDHAVDSWDCMLVDPLSVVGIKEGVVVRALCFDYGKKLLTSGRLKVNKEIQSCPPFSDKKKVNCVTVHLTNQEVHKDVKRSLKGSIVIGRDNLSCFFGPVLGRTLWSPYTKKELDGKTTSRTYCTARMHRNASCRLPTTSSVPRNVYVFCSRMAGILPAVQYNITKCTTLLRAIPGIVKLL